MTETRPKLLVVEDDAGLQAQLKWAYEDFDVVVAGDRTSALALLRAETPDVVTLDLGLPPDPDGTTEGFAVLDEIMALKPDTKVIVASGHGARESALQAIARGAYDFYQKPVDIDALGLIVRRALQLHRLEEENRRLASRVEKDEKVLGRLITAAPEMVRVGRTIERVANTNVSVMLLGASGTGKELLARGLHEASGRAKREFVAINCAAIPENLLESELFGHEKGAFTGAITSRAGRFELANGGTLFLDEIGDMPLPMQVKLLRVLQERTFERVGSNKTQSVDVRIIAATHKNLESMIEVGSFREDLYYRLNVFPIEMAPLRERVEDIPLLMNELISRMEHEKRGSIRFNSAAIMSLCRHGWPGNVRELANLVERMAIMHPYGVIGVVELPKKFRYVDDEDEQLVDSLRSDMEERVAINGHTPDFGSTAMLPPEGLDLKDYLGNLEQGLIQQALDDANGIVARAAERLRIRRTTLVEKMRKYGMSRKEGDEQADD